MTETECVADRGDCPLVSALAAFHVDLAAVSIPKTGFNSHFQSSYPQLFDVMSAAMPILAKHGLAVIQFSNGEQLTTELLHKSGESRVFTCRMPLSGNERPQVFGSMLTYFRRYSLMSILMIPVDEPDDDGIAAETAKVKPAGSNPRPAPKVQSESQGDKTADGCLRWFQEHEDRTKAAIREGKAAAVICSAMEQAGWTVGKDSFALVKSWQEQIDAEQ